MKDIASDSSAIARDLQLADTGLHFTNQKVHRDWSAEE